MFCTIFDNWQYYQSTNVWCYSVFPVEPSLQIQFLENEFVNFPLYFGTVMFGLQSINVSIVSESQMAKPKDFVKFFGVLNISMALATVLFILIGTMGYWRYGKNIKPSITLNFPVDNPVGQAVRILYSSVVFINYGMNILITFKIFWEDVMKKHFDDLNSKKKKMLLEYSFRFICVIITFIISIVLPFLGPFISLIGNVSLSFLIFSFPALMKIFPYWPDAFGFVLLFCEMEIIEKFYCYILWFKCICRWFLCYYF